jgi:hypothetical protein
MTLTDTLERVDFIKGLLRTLVRYRMGDGDGDLPKSLVDEMTTSQDHIFILDFLRLAEPLYPWPKEEKDGEGNLLG